MSRLYRKDSFDRFGDDLCQHILSHLSLEDRFRGECVSKQFQRLIYATQRRLTPDALQAFKWFRKLHDNSANTAAADDDPTTAGATAGDRPLLAYESVLRKCRCVTHVEFAGNNRMFEALIRYCDRLQSFQWTLHADITVRTIEEFFAKFADQLTAITCETRGRYLCQKAIVRHVRSCRELREFRLDSNQENQTLSHIFGHKSECLLENIRRLQFPYDSANREAVKRVDLLAAHYGRHLRAVHLVVQRCDDDVSVRALAAAFARMPALIDIRIDYKPTDDAKTKLLAPLLRHIGAHCRHVRRLHLALCVTDEHVMSDIVSAVNHLCLRVRRLTIKGSFPGGYVFTGAALKRVGRRLTHLTISTGRTVTPCVCDSLFANIDKHMPRLHRLSLANANVTDQSLQSLARLSRLESIQIDYSRHQLTGAAIAALRGCRKIRLILIRRQSVLTSRHPLIPNFYPQFLHINYPFVQMP